MSPRLLKLLKQAPVGISSGILGAAIYDKLLKGESAPQQANLEQETPQQEILQQETKANLK